MLGRETPIYILQNLILSFGGSFVLQDDDDSLEGVTHVCMDRPVTSSEKGIEYVSPQYIVDSINNLFLLPTKPYMPGQVSFISQSLIHLFIATTSPSQPIRR